MANIHEKYMRIAIELAQKAEGETSPNPAVGALVVKGAKVIGRGFHERCGLPHAEVNALADAGSRAKGGTLYVTLEPCDHFGRTPPCTDAIIRSGIKNVFIGMADPNPANNGRGMAKLRKSGIKTTVGILEEEARSINLPYIKFMTRGLPYVTVKVAESLDGKIATRTGDSKWITGEDSRRYVRSLRGRVDAVMVGVNTVVKDNPMLLADASSRKQPVRIIVDTGLRTPPGARIFSYIKSSPVIIAAARWTRRARLYQKRGAEVVFAGSKKERVNLTQLLKILAKRGIAHLFVEGGGELIAAMIEEGLVDRFLFFIAPKIIGGRHAKTSVEGRGFDRVGQALVFTKMKARMLDTDILIEAEA